MRDLFDSDIAEIKAPLTFEWGAVVTDTGMKGLTALMARHVELKSYDANVPKLEIEVHEQLRPIAEDGALAAMHEKLKMIFGPDLAIVVQYGPAASCLAISAQKKRVTSMSAMMTTLTEDPFIAQMAKEFGAVVFVDSIKQESKSAIHPSSTPQRLMPR